MFEHRQQRLISVPAFAARVTAWAMLTVTLIALSLAVGVCGYHYFEHLSWLDSFLNAAMILGGMGQVDPLHTEAGKIFAACYALYSGIFLIICGGLLLMPIFHRILHHFHVEK